ncbi:cation diffusion facilitator family transporter [Luteimonas sp. 22616]|uniref:cation diffusion facilitator family transporter n=1 Tax=Luteimonas sp. 22616 TaxID=3453951 RepID=UPI003F86F7D6
MTSGPDPVSSHVPAHAHSTIYRLALGSIGIGVLVLGLKFLAWKLTGSVALYSDALESIINVATAIAAFIAVRVSAMPADDNHPYGHTKAEYFSAVLEGVLIILAALAILREAWRGFIVPEPIDAPMLGLAISGAATLLNLAWGTLLIRRGKRLRSPALVADGKHLMTDVWTSAGVIVGVALVALTGWTRLDPAIAALVALNILWAGWKIMHDSVAGLMDAALPPEDVARIEAIIAATRGPTNDVHELRTRHAGRLTFIDFSLRVPGTMSVDASHAVCDDLEDALRREFPESSITIHVEPRGHVH